MLLKSNVLFSLVFNSNNVQFIGQFKLTRATFGGFIEALLTNLLISPFILTGDIILHLLEQD